MKSGHCRSCLSATVYARESGVGEVYIHVRTGGLMSVPVPVLSFVCATCGYFEQYIYDAAKLAQVAQTWQQVPVQPHP